MAAETQYTANTGFATITEANTSLSSGTTFSVITGASPGTLIKTVTIICQGETTEGMIRLWIYDGSSVKKVISEIEIPAVVPSATDPVFQITIPVDFALKSSWQLLASSEKYTGTNGKDKFNVIAEGLDWAYYTSSVRPESIKYTANTAMNELSLANTTRDATGENVYDILTAASNGTQIQSVIIKAQGSPSAGMIRLFLYNGSTNTLLREIPVIATTQSGTAHSFSERIDFGGKGFALKSTWHLKATTQIANTFNVIAEGLDWTYPA